jgi:predicted transcriptional regulator
MEIPHVPQEEFIEPTQSRTIRVSGSDISQITKALKSPTRQKILSILRDTPLDVSRIAKRLSQTEANISAQVQLLQKAGLVSCRYEAGDHGVRKICEVVVDKIIITLE